MRRPTLTYILPDKVGGVFSYLRNLLAHSATNAFDIQVILTHGRRDHDSRSSGRLAAPKVEIFEHDLPGENLYAVLRRLYRLLPPGPGVVVTNDWLELAMLSVHDPGKMVVNVSHGDYHYYYDLALKHEAVIDYFIAVSARIAERLRHTLKHRDTAVLYLPHGVEIGERPRRAPSGPLRIIFVGRMTAGKGVFDLPEIDRQLRERGLDVAWTLVGDGPDGQRLRASWGDDPRRRWLGALPHDAVLPLYEDHDVFLLPSRAEGFPVTVAEAGAAGVVPVVSDLPSGIPEIVIPNLTGYRVPVGDSADFASALEELDRDRARLERMSSAVRQLVAEKFDIRRNVVQYDSLYARYGESRRPRGQCGLHYGSRLDKPWLPNLLVRGIRALIGPHPPSRSREGREPCQ
jgi:glycosyltransferase involved in cell wall biosynthesis